MNSKEINHKYRSYVWELEQTIPYAILILIKQT